MKNAILSVIILNIEILKDEPLNVETFKAKISETIILWRRKDHRGRVESQIPETYYPHNLAAIKASV
jgi:hypothetical protein